MSSHHNRRKRRQISEVPLLVERVQKTVQGNLDLTQSGVGRRTYEEEFWDTKISPRAREIHNRLRVARGLSPLPPPKIDKYVAPKTPLIRPIDHTDEYIAAIRQGIGPVLPGNEAFEIKKI